MHPRIRHLGYVSDQDKYDVLAGAEALVMPSYFESLSMVMLEAWAIGVPVLANGRCDVLAGQCLRSNGGLFYANGREFEAMLDTLLDDPALADELGENGRAFYDGPLRVAGDRARLSGHVRAAGSWRSGQPDGTASGMAGRPPAHRAAWRRCRGRGPARTGPDGREERDRVVKLAFITPRYGADLIAGPEHACRLLAEHTGHRHDIDVLTTCARDSRTWKNEYPEGPTGCAASASAASRSPNAIPTRRHCPAWRRVCSPSRTRGPRNSTGCGGAARGRRGCSTISSGSTATTTPWCSSA